MGASLGQTMREGSPEEVTFPQRWREPGRCLGEERSWQREQQLAYTVCWGPIQVFPFSICLFSFPLGFLVKVPFRKSLTLTNQHPVEDLYQDVHPSVICKNRTKLEATG